jgi:hypothetical protein
MTVFDRLEAQLLDAHPSRARRSLPRPELRPVLAFAAAMALLAALLVAFRPIVRPAGPAGPGLMPPAQTVPAATNPVSAAGATERISVLNATAKPGLAGRLATDLSDSGLLIGTVENAPVTDAAATRVYYRAGGERTAALVAALLKLDGAAPAPPSLRPFDPVVVVAGGDRIHGPVIILPDGLKHRLPPRGR